VTDRQINRQTLTGKECTETGEWRQREKRWMHRWIDGQIDKQTDRLTGKERTGTKGNGDGKREKRWMHRWMDRQTDRQTRI